MKNLLRHLALQYFDSRWIPSAVALVTLIIFTLGALVSWKPLTILVNGLLILVGVSILGILAASIWNLIKKRWVNGIINLVMLPISGVVSS